MEPLAQTYLSEIEGNNSSKAAHEIAVKNGWKVILPEANQLLIDIDNEADYQVWSRARHLIEKTLKIKKVVETPSKSEKPGKWHITVDLGVTLTAAERITLQAMLGSDRMREILSFFRLQNTDSEPTLFYEKS